MKRILTALLVIGLSAQAAVFDLEALMTMTEKVYVNSDMERQEVLEKAGWQFYRIRYSDWLEKSEAREDLMRPIQTALLG